MVLDFVIDFIKKNVKVFKLIILAIRNVIINELINKIKQMIAPMISKMILELTGEFIQNGEYDNSEGWKKGKKFRNLMEVYKFLKDNPNFFVKSVADNKTEAVYKLCTLLNKINAAASPMQQLRKEENGRI